MKLYKALIFATLVAISVVGCNNEDPGLSAFENKVYLNITERNPLTIIEQNGVVEFTKKLSAAIATPITKPIDLSCTVDMSLLEQYNQIYKDKAVSMPEANYTITESKASIAAGWVSSSEMVIDFKGMDQLDRNTVYVLPVVLDQATNIPVLASRSQIFYVFTGGALVNYAAELTNNFVDVNWTTPSAVKFMNQLSVEMLIRPNKFDHEISTLLGVEGHFMVRLGDATLYNNQVQLATAGKKLLGAKSEDLRVPENKWTHIAVTFDGTTGEGEIFINGLSKAKGMLAKSQISLDRTYALEEEINNTRGFHIGYAYEKARYFDGDICEVRIWNKILTSDDVRAKDHFYYVDPKSEGLVAYWKFNEGAGKAVKDHSVNGNHAAAINPLMWSKVSLGK